MRIAETTFALRLQTGGAEPLVEVPDQVRDESVM